MDNDVELFKKSFDRAFDAAGSVHKKTITTEAFDHTIRADSQILEKVGSTLPAVDEEYAVQRPIRKWFGKATTENIGKIGPHPDFKHLAGTEEIIMHHITTVFVDITNSTRLSLRYSLPDVRHIKNTILQVASEAVRALDGHVHRFMGDALMAYFGGQTQRKESSAMAAISCAVMLQLLMKEVVTPGLQRKGFDPMDIGFRIGLDFGDDTEVMWSSYGFSEVHEVTATSFHVDASAKLQSMASKDTAMSGSNLINHLDLPGIFTKLKNRIKNGERTEVPYLLPNYQTVDNSPLNYAVRELHYDNLLAILPLPTELKAQLVKDAVHHDGFSFRGYVADASGKQRPYPSLSECLPKNLDLVFELRVEHATLISMQYPLKGKFVVKNFGKEATEASALDPQVEPFELRPQGHPLWTTTPVTACLKRGTLYRGVHLAIVHIEDARGEIIFADIIAVHIE
ncbi:nucleotide-binding domain-containing protein [Burkholderia pseudomultivorans]|uniref:nucleotide-binding domain-containing protein n=1 Tax=Burkholderia pseudomultivorans TaxID=1207504 RepID=UPI0009C006AA|nr:adenylate/guanylate cyclase domain-containing protein [Burkholderia pseudomultivorans]